MKYMLSEIKNSVGYVTLNRPQQLNALNLDTMKELQQVFDNLAKEDVRCVILTGAGEKAFAAGADTVQLEHLDSDSALHLSNLGNQVCLNIQYFKVPVIAVVNGYALGGGCELALACDIRIASEKAVFGLPETMLGIYPGWGGTQRLARVAGYGAAAEMIFSANRITAKRAWEIGLVNQVSEQAMETAVKLAERIAANAPLAIQAAKQIMLSGLEDSLHAGVKQEAEGFSCLFRTEDCKQGLKAFNHREQYQFTGQ